MDVSIIIVNYHSEGLARECVKEFTHLHTSLSQEIIVVDNSPGRGLETILQERFPAVHYISMGRNVGLSRANNAGARRASGDHILICNPDVTPHAGSLDTMVGYLRSHPDVGIVGPRLHNPDGAIQQSYYRFYRLLTPMYRRTIFARTWLGKRHLQHFLMRDVSLDIPTSVDWLLGAVLCVRRKDYEDVGMMDEKFFLYMEDVDLCRTFWKSGKAVHYLPNATMTHLYHRESAGGGILDIFKSITRIHIMSSIKYFFKHGINTSL
ncbi:MAG: glycosyltransferase family 2 protein [bacterium]|nr:glycosyltransferase family 2 protein [bacterium]